jgi:hypothetical protein
LQTAAPNNHKSGPGRVRSELPRAFFQNGRRTLKL